MKPPLMGEETDRRRGEDERGRQKAAELDHAC